MPNTSDGSILKVSIIIPTVDRRDALVRCVLASTRQRGAPAETEIVIVDNSPDARQIWILDSVSGAAPAVGGGIRYVHEPRSGLAHARNCGVASARGEFLAFVDDDEAPQEGWVAAHLRALELTSGDASFGPVVPIFEGPEAAVPSIARRLYTRSLAVRQHAEVGAMFNKLGSGNSCYRVATCFASNVRPYDARFNRIGGEDTDLLRRLATRGRRLIWTNDAFVNEFVPTSRLSVEYMARRRFSQGQFRTYLHIATPPKRYDRAAFWMTVGVAQVAYHKALGLFASLSGHDEAALVHRIQAEGGLGKIFWQSRFRDTRYGYVDGC